MAKVSVIIPCYNDGHYLQDSIGSVLKQTFTDWEIIVVNDGSTDANTLTILAGLTHEKIKVLHKENGHLSSARNFGINQAGGEIIVTLDADDTYEKTFFEKGVKLLEAEPSTGVVTCYLKSFGNRKYQWKPLGGDIKNFLYRLECCASAMYRKQCWVDINGYDENMKKGYEDWEFWIRVTAAGWKVAVIKEFLLNYRTTATSMSQVQSEPNRKAILDYIMEKHKDLYWQHIKEAVYERKLLDLRNAESTTVLLKHLYWRTFKQQKK